MVRSSGFGSVNYDLKPLSGSLSLWLRYSLILTLPQPTSRQLILQQARSRALSRSSTACKPMVSCSISLPSRGSFHLSLTVLVHYRWPRVFSLGGWSPQIPTRFHVSRGTQQNAKSFLSFIYRTITFYGNPFQVCSTRQKFYKTLCLLLRRRQAHVTTPW